MNEFIVSIESELRLGVFVSVFVILTIVEIFRPRRWLRFSKSKRWLANIGITVFNTVIMRLIIPVAALSIALQFEETQQGLFHQLSVPAFIAIPAFLVIFDCVIYWQHRLFHKIPILWRLHRMHHTDPDIDFTTATRFHPIEIFISAFIKISVVALLGAPAVAVVLAEVILNASAMFNHSNIKIPLAADRLLRKIIVTPDMHRVHHSIFRREHDSNYGFNLSCWDYLFSSYVNQPEGGHDDMEIGISGFQDRSSFNPVKMLFQPLK